MQFFVAGLPRPQGSKHMVRTKGGRTLMLESSKGLGDWRTAVCEEATRARWDGRQLRPVIEGPVDLMAVFLIPRPASHLLKSGGLRKGAPEAPTGKPDADKLVRAIGDAITGVLIRDDSQITRLDVTKIYTRGAPGVAVRVSPAVVLVPGRAAEMLGALGYHGRREDDDVDLVAPG
jgi:Holliday junction resolvase RusA-like endonuclease